MMRAKGEMGDRGEGSFRKLPGFAAGLYDRLTQAKAVQSQFREIAPDLVSRVVQGRLEQIGHLQLATTSHGRGGLFTSRMARTDPCMYWWANLASNKSSLTTTGTYHRPHTLEDVCLNATQL